MKAAPLEYRLEFTEKTMWFKKTPKKSKSEIAAERMQIRQSWIGKEAIVAQTVEIKKTTMVTVTNFPVVTVSNTISGIVSAVGERCIKIGNFWYEEDWTQPGGIRIIEIIGSNVALTGDESCPS